MILLIYTFTKCQSATVLYPLSFLYDYQLPQAQVQHQVSVHHLLGILTQAHPHLALPVLENVCSIFTFKGTVDCLHLLLMICDLDNILDRKCKSNKPVDTFLEANAV